jgi:hypothetical protein
MCTMQYFRQITLGISIAALVAMASPAGAQSGSIYAWGHGLGGMYYVPPGSDFVEVSGGLRHHIALRTDGTIVAWGDNLHGQLAVPAGRYSAISTRSNYGLALSSLDGSIAAWGEDRDGVVSGAPTDNGYVAISAGRFHAMALHLDGSIVSWGNDEYGQVSNTPKLETSTTEGDTPNDEDAKPPYFTAISAGGHHSLALLSDGSIDAWGRDNYGQVYHTPFDNNFIAISGGAWNNFALTKDKMIVGWGYDQGGVLSGIPDEGGFVAISPRGARAVALKEDGSIVQWPESTDPSLREVRGKFISIHSEGALLGIAEDNPFDPWQPVDSTGRWQPVAEGLLDTTTNLVWGFGANEVNHYLGGGVHNMDWRSAQLLPILDLDANTTYPAFSNQFFGQNNTDWRLPTIEEMRAAYSAGLIHYLDASPRPGFQRLGFVGGSSETAKGNCVSSTSNRKDSGWWLNFDTGLSGTSNGFFINYVAVRPGPAPVGGDGGGTGGGKPKK